MEYCVSSKTMQNSDQATINGGTAGYVLMDRAGKSVFDSLDWTDKKIYIFVGYGNNGGDGYALAMHMLEHDIYPYIYEMGTNKSPTAKVFKDKLLSQGYDKFFDVAFCDYDCDIAVDCIFGVGFSRSLDDITKDIFAKISQSRAYVVSVDIPSGLNSDNGLGKDSVQADMTIAIQSYKLGHYLGDGKDKCGQIKVVDIGIEIIGEQVYIADDDYAHGFFPPRLNNTNKSTYGKSVILGGCSNYAGAIKLANIGSSALRCGCGLNVIAASRSVAKSVRGHILDSTIFEIAEQDDHLVFDQHILDKLMSGVSAVAIGMGMGNSYEDNAKIIDYILHNFNGKVLLDADGLNSLQGRTDILNNSSCQVVITPHPKEMSRLAGISVEQVLANPLQVARDFATTHHVTVLLKGTSTIVTNGERFMLVTNGTPALAKGGSGDVLSGTILGLMARGIDIFDSAVVGAYICGRASVVASELYGEYGTLASDTAISVGRVVGMLEKYEVNMQ